MADDVLAQAEASRKQSEQTPGDVHGGDRRPDIDRPRSRSVSSSGSISTISTRRSRSPSPFRRRLSRGESPERRPRRYSSRSMSKARGRKRQRRSVSSSSRSRSRPRQPGSHRKNRRYRTLTPEDRGRPESLRRGSHRESGSPSVDKSQVTRDRRSLDKTADGPEGDGNGGRHDHGNRRQQRNEPKAGHPRRERSLSPYSKRLALTSAMNVDR